MAGGDIDLVGAPTAYQVIVHAIEQDDPEALRRGLEELEADFASGNDTIFPFAVCWATNLARLYGDRYPQFQNLLRKYVPVTEPTILSLTTSEAEA